MPKISLRKFISGTVSNSSAFGHVGIHLFLSQECLDSLNLNRKFDKMLKLLFLLYFCRGADVSEEYAQYQCEKFYAERVGFFLFERSAKRPGRCRIRC